MDFIHIRKEIDSEMRTIDHKLKTNKLSKKDLGKTLPHDFQPKFVALRQHLPGALSMVPHTSKHLKTESLQLKKDKIRKFMKSKARDI